MIAGAITPTVIPRPGSRVRLMLTCLCDAFFPDAAMAAVECLERAGFTVAFDEAQACCSQPAFNSGDWPSARRAARHAIRTFDGDEPIVVPSGSCAAMVRWGFPQLFEGEEDLAAAVAMARRTWEFAEFLGVGVGLASWPGRYPRRVALHRSCHLRELATGDTPERLLRSIDGLELVPVPEPEQCCGFGGTFAAAFPWTSARIGDAKLESLRASGAEEVASTDMGCAMHLDGRQRRLAREGGPAPLPIRHVAEVLRDSLRSGAGPQ